MITDNVHISAVPRIVSTHSGQAHAVAGIACTRSVPCTLKLSSYVVEYTLCYTLHAALHAPSCFGFRTSTATLLQIVVINPVDPDNLPPLAAAPAVTTSPGEKKQRQTLAPKPKDPVVDSPKPKAARATLEADGPDFIADKKEVQPPVAESIKLASGICLRSGAAVQSGPKRTVDMDHMTKRDHAKYLAKAAAENAVVLTGTKGMKGSKLPSESMSSGRLQPQGSIGLSSAAQVSSPAVQPLKQRRQQQQQPQAAVTMSSVALLTQVSEGEQLKWARDGVPKKIAARTVERPPSPVDPNLALLGDSSWGLTAAVKGRSPAQLPVKEAVAAGKCFCASCLLSCDQLSLTCHVRTPSLHV